MFTGIVVPTIFYILIFFNDLQKKVSKSGCNAILVLTVCNNSITQPLVTETQSLVALWTCRNATIV